MDGSAYVNHVELVRKARGADNAGLVLDRPARLPGRLGRFPAADATTRRSAARTGASISRREVAVITDDVPMGTNAADARAHIKLVMLVNDWSLRNLIPAELAKGFGFYQSKPATAFSPVAVTPDELGEAWHDARVHLPLVVHAQWRAVRPARTPAST